MILISLLLHPVLVLADQVLDEFRTKLTDALVGMQHADCGPSDFDYDDSKSMDRVCFMGPVKGASRMVTKLRMWSCKVQQRTVSDEIYYIEQLGDVLRCTIDCANGDLVWKSWLDINNNFKVELLNNKMAQTQIKQVDVCVCVCVCVDVHMLC